MSMSAGVAPREKVDCGVQSDASSAAGSGMPLRPTTLFDRGDLGAVIELLQEQRHHGPQSAESYNLLGLALDRRGEPEAACKVFAEAREFWPGHADLASNHANALARCQLIDEALLAYKAALLIDGTHRDACFNRALLLGRMGRHEEAAAALSGLAEREPRDPAVAAASGTALYRCGRLVEAAAAYDRALDLDHARPTALNGRARVALERGLPATGFFRSALSRTPSDPELVLGLVEAMDAEDDPARFQLLADLLRRSPRWIGAQRLLARMMFEAGRGDYDGALRSALADAPEDQHLRDTLVQVLHEAGRHEDALEILRGARSSRSCPRAGRDEALLLIACGRGREALTLLGDDPSHLLPIGRAALATGDLGRAEQALLAATEFAPEDVTAWAHLELTWRAMSSPHHEWLLRPENLIAQSGLGLSSADLDAVRSVVQGLHLASRHEPPGQSVRRGTQTRGRLFSRPEPEISLLRQAIEGAVADYRRSLPTRDPGHPLLRHREHRWRIAGSWSVLLERGGRHASHIHPLGIASSACHLTFERDPEDEPQAGYLELGIPPEMLNLAIGPARVIEPEVGAVTIFPSFLFHSTRPAGRARRLAVAFDLQVHG